MSLRAFPRHHTVQLELSIAPLKPFESPIGTLKAFSLLILQFLLPFYEPLMPSLRLDFLFLSIAQLIIQLPGVSSHSLGFSIELFQSLSEPQQASV